eukprot:365319-Chlamydomonas_euryale.AAC.8
MGSCALIGKNQPNCCNVRAVKCIVVPSAACGVAQKRKPVMPASISWPQDAWLGKGRRGDGRDSGLQP